MGEIIGIVAVCAAIVGAAAWSLNRLDRSKNPKEDEEQEAYLKKWNEKHRKSKWT